MRIRPTSILAALVAVLVLAPCAWGTTFTVQSTGASGGACPGASCTLAAAITAANSVTTGGVAPTIQFALPALSTITVAGLPDITRDGTFIDGCNVGRVTDGGLPKPPASAPCVGLRGPGATPAGTGLRVKGADITAIQGVALSNFARGLHLWGADNGGVAGNWFGRNIDGSAAANAVGVSVTGRSSNGAVADVAGANFVGDTSDAEFGSCNETCNVIVNSTVAGIDLQGDPTPASGPGDVPAGGPCRESALFTCGTFVRANWIGVEDPAGSQAAGNATAVRIGDAEETRIGGDTPGNGNVIAGNAHGVDQGSGTRVAWLIGGVYGISPDGQHTASNGPWNARLGGSSGQGSVVDKVTFGPAQVGLLLDGPTAQVTGSSFLSRDEARFTTAAIRLGPAADRAYIGSDADSAASPGCFPPANQCNQITATGPDAPGILVDGADNVRIWRNAIGGGLVAPIPGPPIRFTGDVTGADVGDNDDEPARRNALGRLAGAAIEVGGTATKVVIGDNGGLTLSTLGPPAGLFTDLLPTAGPGNSGAVNHGIQPPVVTVSSAVGVGGTGIPGATIHVLEQQRGTNDGPPVTNIESVTPTTPSTVTVGEDGIWGFQFPTPRTGSFNLLASQTTAADGTSEYSEPLPASATNVPPVVTFQTGPSGVVDSRSATFTFSANRLGTRLTCSVDTGTFVPCSSPLTLNGLDIGGHQLQVKGTDPTGKVGPPASRTWIVQIPEPPAQQPTGSTAGLVRFASLVTLPSAKVCVSRRSLRVRVHAPKGTGIRSADVRIGRRRVGFALGAKTIPVSLKGLPRGRFVVKVTVRLSDGRVIRGSRAYRTCAKKTRRR